MCGPGLLAIVTLGQTKAPISRPPMSSNQFVRSRVCVVEPSLLLRTCSASALPDTSHVTFLADVPEPNGGNDVFDAVHIETLVVAGCDVFNAQLAQQLQQAKVSNRAASAISHIPIPNSNPNDIFLFSVVHWSRHPHLPAFSRNVNERRGLGAGCAFDAFSLRLLTLQYMTVTIYRHAVLVESSSLLELEAVGHGGIIEGVNVQALDALAKQRWEASHLKGDTF